MKKTNLPLICAISALLAVLSTTSCSRSPSDNDGKSKPVLGCSSNPYLTKYGCSIERIQQAAESGNADAQYGLGYMYYYGIDTVRDKQTAELWIQRAAAQGQPLAKKAWTLINTGATFGDLHEASAKTMPGATSDVIAQQEPADVSKMNATQPTQPITSYLPGYKSSLNDSSTKLTTGTTQDLKDVNAPAQEVTANNTSNTNNVPTKAPIAKNNSIMDPRLSSNAKPVTASKPSQYAASPSTKTVTPAALAMTTKPAPTDSTTTILATAIAPEKTPGTAVLASSSRVPMPDAPVAATALAAAPATPVATTQTAFTLQIMGSDRLSDVKTFMAEHNLDSTSQYYRTQLNGKPWYMLTYGNYQTKEQAIAALHQLPSSLDQYHPWVKTLATVNKEVATQKVIA